MFCEWRHAIFNEGVMDGLSFPRGMTSWRIFITFVLQTRSGVRDSYTVNWLQITLFLENNWPHPLFLSSLKKPSMGINCRCWSYTKVSKVFYSNEKDDIIILILRKILLFDLVTPKMFLVRVGRHAIILPHEPPFRS